VHLKFSSSINLWQWQPVVQVNLHLCPFACILIWPWFTKSSLYFSVSYNFAFHYNRIKSPYLSVTSKSFYVLVPTSLPALPPILLPQHLHFLQALVTSCCSFPKTHTVFRLFSLPESHLFFLTLNTCLLDLCFLNSSSSILGLSSQGSSSTKFFQTFQSKLPLPSTFPFCLVFFF
jgi:hypothetical protein